MKLMPASSARDRIACAVASSALTACIIDRSSASPKVMAPRHSVDTLTPLAPRLRYSMGSSSRGRIPPLTPGVRPATAADVPALAALINRAYRVEDFFIDGDRTSEADVRRQIDRFLILEEEDGALGACVLVQVNGERGYLGVLSVDPDRQGGGR